jgi:hypothetical protein
MAINQKHKTQLELMLIDAIDEVMQKADALGIEHPYWNEDTAALMACAAMCVVQACELPKEEAG